MSKQSLEHHVCKCNMYVNLSVKPASSPEPEPITISFKNNQTKRPHTQNKNKWNTRFLVHENENQLFWKLSWRQKQISKGH